ncbi:BTB/POZ domain-containing protein [Phthorimaea operculella]|nr:BTB/POZ domain-containing protein [Phthorimaea operculella]
MYRVSYQVSAVVLDEVVGKLLRLSVGEKARTNIIKLISELWTHFIRRMEIKIQSRKANELDLQVTVTHNTEEKNMAHMSPKYLLGTVYFQFKVDSFNGRYDNTGSFVVSAKYLNAAQNDNLMYSCSIKVNSLPKKRTYDNLGRIIVKEVTQPEPHQNFTDKENWHTIVYKFETGESKLKYIFTINIQFDLNTQSVSPLVSLYEDTELTDFDLKSTDGSVSVHSSIVAGVSPVLKKIITGNWQETLNKSVTIPDVTKDTLEHFKKYMYLDQLPENVTELEKLRNIGSCYLIPDLVQKSIVKILFQITPDNIVNFLEVAVQYKIDFLLTALLKMVQEQVIVLNTTVLNLNSVLEVSSSDVNNSKVD